MPPTPHARGEGSEEFNHKSKRKDLIFAQIVVTLIQTGWDIFKTVMGL
jgi:hypothetical protein